MKKEDSTKEEEEEEENESETLKVSIPGNLPIEPLSIPTQNSTNGASQLAEDLSILSNLHKFKFDRDDLIDIAIPTHPGVTNAGVTKQASLYIASLNLLQIFDMMDDDCDGYVNIRDLKGLMYSCCCNAFGSIEKIEEELNSAFKRVVLLKRPNSKHILYREFPRIITYMCHQDVDALKAVMKSMHDHLSRKLPSRSPRILKYDSTTPGNRVAIEENPILRELVEHLPGHHTIFDTSWCEYLFEITFRRFTSIHAFLCFMLWQFTFSCWYCFYPYTEFRFDRAFYYSAQAGLSVGFGALSEEIVGGVASSCEDMCLAQLNCTIPSSDFSGLVDPLSNTNAQSDVSRAATILNVILGSSIIGGALSYFVQVMIDRQQELKKKIESDTKRKKAVFTYEKTMKIMEDETKKKKRKSKKQKMFPFISLIREQIIFRCLQCGWSIEDRFDDILTVLVITVFIATGVTFGMWHEGWGFIKSLYFSITTMSTAGLQGPSTDSKVSMVFTGIYVLVGVPLYAYCLGRYSEFLIKFTQERKIIQAMEEIISLNEIQFLQKLNNTHNNGIGPFEFLQMELLRTGKCDQSFIDKVAKRFSEFDILQDGEITLPEIIAANIFESYDVDDSNELEFGEFKKMIKFMIGGKWNKRFGRIVKQTITDDKSIRKVFNICDSSGDGLVNRGEFLEWISKISINQRVLWRGRVKFHSKHRKNEDYIVVLTKKSFEFRPAQKEGGAIFTQTEAIRLKHVEQIRFDEDGCVWISVSKKSEFVREDEDVVTMEMVKQKVADRLLRECLKIDRIQDKVSGLRRQYLNDESDDEDDTKMDTKNDSCVVETRPAKNHKILNFNIFRAMSKGIRKRSVTVRNTLARAFSPRSHPPDLSKFPSPLPPRKIDDDKDDDDDGLDLTDGEDDDDGGGGGLEMVDIGI